MSNIAEKTARQAGTGSKADRLGVQISVSHLGWEMLSGCCVDAPCYSLMFVVTRTIQQADLLLQWLASFVCCSINTWMEGKRGIPATRETEKFEVSVAVPTCLEVPFVLLAEVAIGQPNE